MKLSLGLLPLFFYGIIQAGTLNQLNKEQAPFKLPELGYKTSALAPAIDEATMQTHHGKHHKAYVDKLNGAMAENKSQISLLQILKSTKNFSMAVRNNAGGHWNHSFFWSILSPDAGKSKISKELAARIDKDFVSLEKMKEQFEKQSLDIFGSGWAWLIVGKDGSLKITSTPNQDNPLMDVVAPQGRPILGLDVWEHAYYLNYQNKRADYVKAFWGLVNWQQVSDYYSEKP
ncbi:MAG: superoxide dismutase [Bdellovibrio sp. 28-41-41]|nr:MAG: superoxide dismutase [Bdellovibrio sp. 28-41-41]